MAFLLFNFESNYDVLKSYSPCFLLNKNINFKGALSGLRQLLATESPLKVMKNAFYCTLNAFCLDILVMQKNDLITTITLISKLMKSQPGE